MENFVQEYVSNGGYGEEAYVKVHPVSVSWDRHNRRSVVRKLLSKVKVKARIDELVEERKKKYVVTSERVPFCIVAKKQARKED